MAPSPSVEERLLDQLHDWDEWARGYAGWPAPVRLEPPFRPFAGHELLYLPVHDDGRRPTIMSQFVDALLGRQRPEVPALPPAPVTPPKPETLDELPLRTFDAAISRDYALRDDTAAALLMSLSGARLGVAFEIVGTREGAVVQVSCRMPDEAVLRRSLATYCPGVVLTEASDRLRDFLMEYPEHPVAVAHLALAREFFIPLAYPGKLSPDPLLAVFAALDDVAEGELAAMQVLLEPARQPWAPSIVRAVTNSEGEDFFSNAPEITKLAKRKALQPLFGVVLRVLAAGEDEYAIRSRFVRLATAIGQFEAPDRNSFLVVNEDRFDDEDFLLDTFLRRSHRSGMLLSLEELLPLVHFPAVAQTSLRVLGRETRRTKAAPPQKAGVPIGVNVHAGRSIEVSLDAERLRRHIHVIGASGSGKSNLLLELLKEDIRQGGGVALLDPHGDLVDDLLARIPDSRQKDVILFDPSDEEWPVGMNVLQAHSDVERTLLASDLVGIFRRLSTSWGDQMHTVFAQAIQAMLESRSGGTVADLRRFLVDPEFRREFLRTIEDEETVFYWTKQYPLLRGRPESPILTRLDAFLRPRLIRNMVTQRETRLDFRRVMDEGKIFLAKLAQGAIGEENAALLGSFLVAKFHQVAMSRQDTALASRRTFLLAIDEFQHFVTPSMASLLTGARKFALGLALSHQDLHQLQSRDTEVYHAVLANAGTRICFRLSDHDAKQLAEGFSAFTPEDLRTLPVGEAICRFGAADRDFNLAVPLADPVDEAEVAARRERIRALSRAAYVRKLDREKPSEPPRQAELTPEAEKPQAPPTPAPRPPAERRRPEPPKERPAAPLGRGGPQHKYLQSLVKQIGEAHGYRATIEYPLPGSESVDVLLERDGHRIACEISIASTADYEAGNLRKCLAAGFEEVVLLAPDEKKLRKLEAALLERVPAEDRRRVAFLTPEELLARLAAAHRPPEETKVGGYSVRVSYRSPSAGADAERKRTIASVLAKSLGKLNDNED